jgi:hypothetical protein
MVFSISVGDRLLPPANARNSIGGEHHDFADGKVDHPGGLDR